MVDAIQAPSELQASARSGKLLRSTSGNVGTGKKVKSKPSAGTTSKKKSIQSATFTAVGA